MSRIFSRGAGGFGAPGEDPELAMELERIESGCVPHLEGDRCLMILKESAEKEAFLRGAREISAGFFLVEKREFPSVSMDLRIRTEAGLNLRYEHFFLIESPEEVSFLEALGRSGAFFLVFPRSGGESEIGVELDERERKSLRSVLGNVPAADV